MANTKLFDRVAVATILWFVWTWLTFLNGWVILSIVLAVVVVLLLAWLEEVVSQANKESGNE